MVNVKPCGYWTDNRFVGESDALGARSPFAEVEASVLQRCYARQPRVQHESLF